MYKKCEMRKKKEEKIQTITKVVTKLTLTGRDVDM